MKTEWILSLKCCSIEEGTYGIAGQEAEMNKELCKYSCK